VKAAAAESIASLPVVYVDLDEAGERSLNLALNRIHGEWDEDLLAKVLEEIQSSGGDLTLTGFEDSEIAKILAEMTATRTGFTEPDDVPALLDDPVTERGEIVKLGRHRMLCGDATNGNMVDRLMVNPDTGVTELADCMWTDPPYGVEYVGKTSEKLTIKNDCGDGLRMLLLGAFEQAGGALRPGAPIYVASPAGPRSVEFLQAFIASGWLLRQTLVWVKDVFVMGHSDYHYRHEPIVYGYKPGAGRLGRGGAGWHGNHKQSTVLEVERPKASVEHPTMKPVELIERCLANSTVAGETVLDPFLGSGSTVLACEKTGRRCLGIEIDRRYADVVVRRWENYTGKTAKRGVAATGGVAT
jgi:DNA modification methylase